jgi:hypothetical protein
MKTLITINTENFFDVAEAIHCFCTLNHGGQTSELYSILSRSEFKPGPLWSESNVELENDFYSELTEENVSAYFDALNEFFESDEYKDR